MNTKGTHAREMFAKLWVEGVPLKQILRTIRASRRTLFYWRKAMGLPRRRQS